MNRTVFIVITALLLAGCKGKAPGHLMYEAIEKCEVNGGVKEFNTWSGPGHLSVWCENGAEFYLTDNEDNREITK